MGRGIRSSGNLRTRDLSQASKFDKAITAKQKEIAKLKAERAKVSTRLRSLRSRLGNQRRAGKPTQRLERQIRKAEDKIKGQSTELTLRDGSTRVVRNPQVQSGLTNKSDGIDANIKVREGDVRALQSSREMATDRGNRQRIRSKDPSSGAPTFNTPSRRRATRVRNNRIRNSQEYKEWLNGMSPQRRQRMSTASSRQVTTSREGAVHNGNDIVQFRAHQARQRSPGSAEALQRAIRTEELRQLGAGPVEARRGADRDWKNRPGQRRSRGRPRKVNFGEF